MNPFVVQKVSSNKGHQFNQPPMKYSPFVQNGCFSSVGRNTMQRCPYNTVCPCVVLLQNSKPLPANQPQYVPRPVSLYSGLNVVNRNSSINVLSGKMRGLAEPPHDQTRLVIAKNEPTRKILPPLNEPKFLGKNFTKSPFETDTNRTRLLDVFHKNFNLLRPAIHGVHDRKRKQIVPDEEVKVQNSCNCNKRQNHTNKPRNKINRYVNNPTAMTNEYQVKDQVNYRTVIEEDKNGFLRVCYEPLLDSNESVSKTRVGRSNNSASLVDKDNEPTDLDLTLHL